MRIHKNAVIIDLLSYLGIIIHVVLSFVLFFIFNQKYIILYLFLLLSGWIVFILQKQRNHIYFHMITDDICEEIDNMLMNRDFNSDNTISDCEKARIFHRLEKLYDILSHRQELLKNEKDRIQRNVTDISHQLRTPLSNIKLINEMLIKRESIDWEKLMLLKEEEGQIKKIEFLIQSLTKLSRLELGTISMKKEISCLNDTIRAAIESVFLSAEKKKIKLFVVNNQVINIPHDSKWTTEALFNVLDNAVKYTGEKGNIKITVEKEEFYVKIDVEDNGKGIRKENLHRVFERYFREDDVACEQGIGIGLYLTKHILELQGGYINVKSNVNKATVFSLFLPRNNF